MVLPPHLPPQTCDIKRYHQFQRLKILLVATVFGLVAGLSGASMMIGWIWPGFGGGDSWVVSQRLGVASRNQLEERVATEVFERVAEVYSAGEINRGVVTLPQKNYLGQATVISSDGWLVLYLPRPVGNYRVWQVVLPGGAVYDVDKFLADKLSGLVFLHLISKETEAVGGNVQFKVAGLADSLDIDSDLYVLSADTWRLTTKINDANFSENYPHLDSVPTGRAVLDADFNVGQIVVNNQGRLAGFVTDSRLILPFQYISRLLPGVLNEQKIIYPTLGLEGWYSDEQSIAIAGQTVNGFFVSKGAGELRAGGIIVEANGLLAENDKMWYNVKADEIIKLKVLRAGKNLDLEVKILEKKF